MPQVFQLLMLLLVNLPALIKTVRELIGMFRKSDTEKRAVFGDRLTDILTKHRGSKTMAVDVQADLEKMLADMKKD